MTPQDISNIEQEYTRVHAVTPHVVNAQLSPQTLGTIDQHQRDLNEVIGALESLETYFDGLVKTNQNKLKAASDMRKKLERDFTDCKNVYWTVKREMDRSPSA